MSSNGKPQNLTPSELTRIFSGMSPLKATRYYNKCMTNPDTPKENVSLLMQYREQNGNKFLTDEQMRSKRSKGSWNLGRGYGGGWRDRSGGRVYDSDGFSYDDRGRSYDRYGNERGGYRDGGYDGYNTRPYGNKGRGYGRKKFFRKDIREPRSVNEIGTVITGLGSNAARTKYYNKVVNNPDSNIETVDNIIDFRNRNQHLFASDEEAAAAPSVRKGRWSSMWKPREEFDKMSKTKQRFFAGAFGRRNRAKNTAYGLRVVTDPESDREAKKAMVEVVRENPLLFFKNAEPQRRKEFSDPKTDD